MEEQNLELNHTYLIKFGNTDIISSITVLLITDKAYHIRWNRGLEGNDTWELKQKMFHDYSVVEDISDFMLSNLQTTTGNPTILKINTKWVQCHVCKGFGTIPDSNSSAGTKLCPLCYGSKTIPEVSDITQE
jgi:hypothetical protein